MAKKPLVWSYGITTVPERIENHLLKRTMASLAAAGFDKPRLFIDGGSAANIGLADMMGMAPPITHRNPALHLSGNWILAIWELYLRDPVAHRYVLFQDDIVVCRNLRAYLEACPYEEKSYYNLITYEQNEALADGRTGWYDSNQKGRGAQALMFDRTAVMALLGSPKLADRMQDARRGPKNIDGLVSDSLRVQGFREKVHCPSLVAHTGEKSTIGHDMRAPRQRSGATFPGEVWDPMQDTLADKLLNAGLDTIPTFPRTITPAEIRKLAGDAPTIVEIGCHDGKDTVAFLAEMPDATIHCFDCERRALARFTDRLGGDARVTLHVAAVADVDGMRDFHASTGKAGRKADWDYSGSLCVPTGHLTRSPEIGFKEPEPVPCVRLDTWHKSAGSPKIDFCWADVQGSQRLVIDGGRETMPHVRWLYIEAHDPVAYAGEPTQQELIELLAEWFEPVAIYAKENILFRSKTGATA